VLLVLLVLLADGQKFAFAAAVAGVVRAAGAACETGDGGLTSFVLLLTTLLSLLVWAELLVLLAEWYIEG
jgi:hypothetical protein